MAIGQISLPTLYQRVVLDTSGVDKSASGATRALRDVGDEGESLGSRVDSGTSKAGMSLSSFAKSAANVGRDMTMYVTTPLVGIGIAGIKTAGDFEQTMNTMGAVAGVPGPELAKLSSLALQMGKDTVFSANEAAGAMLELSKSGMSTADIMGGGVQATLALAAAGGLKLADASRIAGVAMNTFGLDGTKAGQVADALAGAANASSADVSDLALALSQGGQAAKTAGLTVQETTAALGAFADAGLRGSDAGTSLKTFLLNLVPSSKEAASTMADLGLKFTDANGKFLSLSAISQQLKDKLGGLSDAQRTQALQTIFGTDAFRAANVLMDQGAAGLQKYIDATSKTGTAQDVADARMKGWAGTWEQFRGSVETAALALGNVLIPAITPVVDKVKELADMFTALDPGMQKLIGTFAAIAAAAGPVIFILAKAVAVVQTILPVLQAVGAAAASTAGIIGIAVAAIGAALYLAYDRFEGFRNVVDSTWQFVQTAWDGISAAFVTAWQGMIYPTLSAIGGFITAVIVPALGVLWQAFQGAWNGITTVVVAAWQGVIQPAWDAMSATMVALWQTAQAVWNGITFAINLAWQAIQVVWQGIQIGIDALTAGFNAASAVVEVVWSAIATTISVAWNSVIKPVWDAMYAVVTAVLNPVFQLLQAVVLDVWNMIQVAISAAWNVVILPLWTAMTAFLNGVLMPVFRFLQATVDVVWSAISTTISLAWNSVILPIWTAAVGFVNASFVPVLGFLRSTAETVWAGIAAAVGGSWNLIQPILDAIVGFINGPVVGALNTVRGVAESVWSAFSGAAERAWGALRDIIGAALRTIGGLVSGFLRVVGTIAGAVGLDNIAAALGRGADAAAEWGRESGGLVDWQPVGAGFKTNGPRAVVGEGNPRFPEYVIPSDPKYRSNATKLLGAAASQIMPERRESGGLVPMLAGGGVLGWAADAVGAVVKGIGTVAGYVGDAIADLAKMGARWVVEKAWPKLGVPDNIGGIPPSAFNSMRQTVIDKLGTADDEKKKAAAAASGGGGGLAGSTTGLDPEFLRRFNAWNASLGNILRITSGFRTRAQQEALYAAYLNGTGNLAAKPGTSMHEKGLAIDHAPANWEMDKSSIPFGLRHPVPSEAWHVEPFDRGGWLQPGLTMAYNGTGKPEKVIPGFAHGGLLGNRLPSVNQLVDWFSADPTPGAQIGMWRHEQSRDPTDPAPISFFGGGPPESPFAGPPPSSADRSTSVVIADGAFRFAPIVGNQVGPADIARLRAEFEAALERFTDTLRQKVRR